MVILRDGLLGWLSTAGYKQPSDADDTGDKTDVDTCGIEWKLRGRFATPFHYLHIPLMSIRKHHRSRTNEPSQKWRQRSVVVVLVAASVRLSREEEGRARIIIIIIADRSEERNLRRRTFHYYYLRGTRGTRATSCKVLSHPPLDVDTST